MEQYNITGMSCAACSASVERAVSGVKGVSSCSVSLLTNSMTVEGTASESDIINAVVNAGYGAEKKGASSKNSNVDFLEDKETPILKKRLYSSLIFLTILMYISMGHTMWGFPMPDFLEGNHIAIGIIQMLLTIAVMIINKKFFLSGFKALLNKSPNMDTLVALGSGASFVYSTYLLFVMTDVQLKGDSHAVMSLMHDFYFESAAMILALITVGKMLEARSKGKTTDALKGLVDMTPKTAIIIKDGIEVEIPASDIQKGDMFIVKPGGIIPADALVIDGYSAVDESALTGESMPVDKKEGDSVSAATINQSGYIRCKATKVGEDTTLSQIIRVVSNAASLKAPIAKAADKVSGIFVPFVIGIAILTFAIWLISGQDIGYSLARGISVLVISCPCALGLATPVAIMVGSGKGAKAGILFKTAVALEEVGKVNIVALDKTGTITSGKPEVTDIISFPPFTEEKLLALAYSLEVKSEHPLAKAISKKAQALGIASLESNDFTAIAGNGLSGNIDGQSVCGGNLEFISTKAEINSDAKELSASLSAQGKTPIFFCADSSLIGIIAVADKLKEDSISAISELKNMGIRVVMLTGDNKRTAAAVGKGAGVDEVFADLLPTDKEKVIRELKLNGKTAMVGDGINDAPALMSADASIAIGAGTDIAMDSADIVLMNSHLSDVPATIRLSRATLKNIHQNLFWAFIYNAIGIPLAAGILINSLGIGLSPMFAAAAMSLSSFCVVSNALRLNLIDIYNSKRDRKIKFKKENNLMEKTLKIEGMMCPHCEARVKKCLEEIDGVIEAAASHENNYAVVTLSKDVPDSVLKDAIIAQGYEIIE